MTHDTTLYSVLLIACTLPREPLAIRLREGERWPLRRAPLDCPPSALERLEWRLIGQPHEHPSGALVGRFVRSGPDTLTFTSTSQTAANALPLSAASDDRPDPVAALGVLLVPRPAELTLAESAFELVPARTEIGPRPLVGRVLLEAVARGDSGDGGVAFRFPVPPIQVVVDPVDNQPPVLELASHTYDVVAGASSRFIF